jgi:hypothetical protein
MTAELQSAQAAASKGHLACIIRWEMNINLNPEIVTRHIQKCLMKRQSFTNPNRHLHSLDNALSLHPKCTSDPSLLVHKLFRQLSVLERRCAINPGVGEDIWSTDTTSPGLLGLWASLWFCEDLWRHGRRVALPQRHAVQAGTGHFSNRRGRTPSLAMICIFLGEQCPNLWCHRKNSAVAASGCRSS